VTGVSVWLVAKWTVFAGLALWMVRAGFFGPPRLFTWPMFSRVSECRMDLVDQAGRPVNPWHHIVHQDPGMNAWELSYYLAYLREVRGVRPSGTVTLVDYTGRQMLTVRDGHVVG
jgi:hypothetical protein